ncbi:MAG: heat-inducible transcription repressor HrcA [Parasporobacterium sp.]|nr:heat-inducible transcription repressor HrcA [Parasporobacterium sp.]
MELDIRKKKILQAIIKNYLETGEPVGSRTISKYTDLELSAATIRNEMADLEEMGYIFQPHTSAGRIPTDAGYRLYVDDMLQSRTEELNEMSADLKNRSELLESRSELLERREEELDTAQSNVADRVERIESVLKDVVKMLANNTNYTSVISMPQANRNKLKFVQLTQIDEKKLLCTVVLEGNIVKNEMIRIDTDMDQQILLRLNLLLNNTLNGLTLQEINFDMAARIAEQAEQYGPLVSDIINHIAATIGSADGIEIFTSGARNIFRYPELSDSMRAGELISTLEEKELLTELMTDTGEESPDAGTGIQVYIGQETSVSSMKDCSMITATYEFEKGVYGKIGIIGPKRMDYEKVVDALNDVTDSLDRKFSKKR